MNTTKRFLSMLLTVLLIVSCFGVEMAAFSASPATKTVEVYAGETYDLVFSEDNCYGIECDIRYDNEALFSSINPWSNNNGRVLKNKVILHGSQPENYAAYLKVTIKADAAVGSRCTVTFYDCIRSDSVDGSGPEGYEKSVTVVVVQKPTPTSSSTTKPTSSSTTKPTVSTKPSVTTKKPTTGLDFTELNKAIAAGEALVAADYTADSWANYETALQAAIAARNAKKQADIDAATNALKAAQAALVKAAGDNKAELESYIQTVKKFLEEDKLSVAYKLLNEAVSTAEAAVAGGSKEEIDAAYSKLKAAFEAYKKAIDDLKTTETIEVEKVVEKDPEGPFCNIFCHKLLLILLIISLILNVLFVIYFVYLRKQKENEPKPAASSDDNDASDILR